MKIKKGKKTPTWGLYFPLKDGKPIQFSHQLLIKLHFTVPEGGLQEGWRGTFHKGV